jgi:hypothetical protein
MNARTERKVTRVLLIVVTVFGTFLWFVLRKTNLSETETPPRHVVTNEEVCTKSHPVDKVARQECVQSLDAIQEQLWKQRQ